MAVNNRKKELIRKLKSEYEQLKNDKNELLRMIAEAELPDMVYNSNAIENSSLTLDDTAKIQAPNHSRFPFAANMEYRTGN